MAHIRGFRKGLTMIEVLVSLTIFLVVLLAVYQLFDTSHATYQSGTRKQDVQQQARLAMDEMVRALRMAGYVPENYDIDPTTKEPILGNDLTGTARLHVGTANAIAAFGSLEGGNQSTVSLFCQSGTSLLKKVSLNTADAASYTCDNADVLADNVSLLRFTYFDQNGAQVAANLDGKTLGAAMDLAPRTARDSIRTIAITLQITEQVVRHATGVTPRQPDQVYTLTSTVRLRNLNNT
jgi:prepilin-type N-terminal cleavage/methylation domain-containing protein